MVKAFHHILYFSLFIFNQHLGADNLYYSANGFKHNKHYIVIAASHDQQLHI